MLNFLRPFAREPARSAPTPIDHAQIAATVESEGCCDPPAALQNRAVISERDLAALPAYVSHGEIPALKANLPLVKQDQISPTQHYAAFRLKDYIDSPGVLDLLFDQDLHQIAGQYLGEQFHIAGITSWKSFATGTRAEAAQQFHRDNWKKKSLALFVYLNDVNSENGAHAYVRSSHNLAAFAKALAQSTAPGLDDDRRAEILHHSYVNNGYGYPLDEAMARYAPHLVHTKIGPAGSVLLTEPRGLHRGNQVRSGYRLMLSIRWHLGNAGSCVYDRGSLYSLLSSRVHDARSAIIAADIQRLYDRIYAPNA